MWREKSDDRVLFRIFCLGGKIRVEIDGGQGSAAEGRCFLGGSGGMPPRKYLVMYYVISLAKYFM